jgi:hypothetical protein
MPIDLWYDSGLTILRSGCFGCPASAGRLHLAGQAMGSQGWIWSVEELGFWPWGVGTVVVVGLAVAGGVVGAGAAPAGVVV